MAESENYKKGTEIRRKLMGEKYADAMNKSVYADPMMQKFGDYARLGQHVPRCGRVSLDLLAQLADIDAQILRID